MDAEKLTRDATIITRQLLRMALNDPGAIIVMMVDDVSPDDIKEEVFSLLEYLEKTKPGKPEEAEKAPEADA